MASFDSAESGSPWLPLARKARRFGSEKIGLVPIDKGPRRQIELTGLEPEPHAFGHPPPQRHHAAAGLVRDLGNLANPMEMRGKRRQEKAPASALDQILRASA